MTGDLRDLMRAAAERAPRPDGLITATRERARRRQHRHRSYLAGGAAVVVAATGAGSALLAHRTTPPARQSAPALTPATATPLIPTGTPAASPTATASRAATPTTVATLPAPDATSAARTTTTAPTGTHNCSEGFSRDVPPASVASELGLLSSDPSYRLQGAVRVQQMRTYCASAALPLIYQRVDAGVVTQALSLTGPIPQSPPGTGTDPTYAGATPVDVRGGTGHMVTFTTHIHLLTWVEPDGTHWSLEASGIDTAQLVSIADGLTLSGTIAADPSTLPPNLTQLPGVPAGPAGELPTWLATYQQGAATFDVEIRRTPGGISPYMVGAAGGNRVVTVLGHPAQINTIADMPKADTTLSLQWAEQPDVLVAITSRGASATDQQIQAFAATLTPVTPTDPRLN